MKKKQKEIFIENIENYQKLKLASKIINYLKKRKIEKDIFKKKAKAVLNYFPKRKKQIIFNAWRNFINSLQKGRVKVKYAQIFNKKYEEIQSVYSEELHRLNDVLAKIQLDIDNEIKERKSLAGIYDMAMNRGVDVFLRETNLLSDFNSSCIYIF